MPKTRKQSSTIARWLKKPGFKAGVAKERRELLLSELVLAIMAEDTKSVRALAVQLGISKTVIQNLRSGEQNDMKLSNFLRLTHAYGFDLVLEKKGRRITI